MAATNSSMIFIDRAGLKIVGSQEYGLAGGRIDSKYAGVIIEYKDSNGKDRISEDQEAPGTVAVITQNRSSDHDYLKWGFKSRQARDAWTKSIDRSSMARTANHH